MALYDCQQEVLYIAWTLLFLRSVVESLRVLYSEYSIYSGEMYRHLNKMPVNVLTHPKRLSSCLRCHRLTIF